MRRSPGKGNIESAVSGAVERNRTSDLLITNQYAEPAQRIASTTQSANWRLPLSPSYAPLQPAFLLGRCSDRGRSKSARSDAGFFFSGPILGQQQKTGVPIP